MNISFKRIKAALSATLGASRGDEVEQAFNDNFDLTKAVLDDLNANKAPLAHSHNLSALNNDAGFATEQYVDDALQDISIGGGYVKPPSGIPKTDLAADVQTSLGKANTALQSFTEVDPIYTAEKPNLSLKTDLTAHNSSGTAHSDIRTDIVTGDDNTLASAKSYTDLKISGINTGTPFLGFFPLESDLYAQHGETPDPQIVNGSWADVGNLDVTATGSQGTIYAKTDVTPTLWQVNIQQKDSFDQTQFDRNAGGAVRIKDGAITDDLIGDRDITENATNVQVASGKLTKLLKTIFGNIKWIFSKMVTIDTDQEITGAKIFKNGFRYINPNNGSEIQIGMSSAQNTDHYEPIIEFISRMFNGVSWVNSHILRIGSSLLARVIDATDAIGQNFSIDIGKIYGGSTTSPYQSNAGLMVITDPITGKIPDQLIPSGGGSSTTVDDVLNTLRFGKSFPIVAAVLNLEVKTQSDFNGLSTALNALINSATTGDINVLFGGGVYKFNDTNMINIGTYSKPNVSVSFAPKGGEKPYFISDGSEYTPNDATGYTPTHYICPLKNPSSWSHEYGYVDQDFSMAEVIDSGYLNITTRINTAASEVTQVSGQTYKFTLPAELAFLKSKTQTELSRCELMLDATYRQVIGRNLQISGNDLQFNYITSSPSLDYNPNADFTFKNDWWNTGHSPYAQFRITNVIDDVQNLGDKIYIEGNNIYIPKSISKLYECKFNRLISINNTTANGFKYVNVNNMNVVGTNKFNAVNLWSDEEAYDVDYVLNYDMKPADATMYFNVNTHLYLHNNNFRNGNFGIQAMVANSVNKCSIRKNDFKNMYVGCIRGDYSASSDISENTSHRSGLYMKEYAAIRIRMYRKQTADNSVINVRNNRISDFGYCAIRFFFRRENKQDAINIKNNVIWFTEDFRKYILRNTLIDGGAIYTNGNQGNVSIVGNIIYDYRDKLNFTYHGIYLDDGSSFVNCKNNLIYHISGFSIASAGDRARWEGGGLQGTGITSDMAGRDNYFGFNILGNFYDIKSNAAVPTGNRAKLELNAVTNWVSNSLVWGLNQPNKDNVIRVKQDVQMSEFDPKGEYVSMSWRYVYDNVIGDGVDGQHTFWIEDDFVRDHINGMVLAPRTYRSSYPSITDFFDAPPSNAEMGYRCIVAENPTGEFEGATPYSIAEKGNSGKWWFTTPVDGDETWNLSDGSLRKFYQGWWQKVFTPSGSGSSVTVIDNLTSTSVSDALSANQGRLLLEKIKPLIPPTLSFTVSKSDSIANDSFVFDENIDLAVFADTNVNTSITVMTNLFGQKMMSKVGFSIFDEVYEIGIDYPTGQGWDSWILLRINKNKEWALRWDDNYGSLFMSDITFTIESNIPVSNL